MAGIAVNEAVLGWAVERSGLSFEKLRKKFPKIQGWRSGEELTMRQLEALAKATHTPVGYFFLADPPEERLPIPHFRTVRDQSEPRPSADLLETVQTMQRRQAWMHEYLEEEGQEPRSFVNSSAPSDQPAQIAAAIRQALDLDAAWAARQPTWTDALQTLRMTMEKAGMLVVGNGVVGNNTHRKLNPNEFRGFVLVDDLAPLVFVNAADAKAAQMFTLAHELAHVWFGSSAAFDLRELQPADDAVERACDKVAAELLIPEAEMRREWPSLRQHPDPFQTTARHFKVSVLVAARRALDLDLIRKSRFLEFYREYLESEHRAAVRKQDGGDFYKTQGLRIGRRFAEAVVRAVKEGRLLYQEAYQLTGLHGKAFDRFASRL